MQTSIFHLHILASLNMKKTRVEVVWVMKIVEVV